MSARVIHIVAADVHSDVLALCGFLEDMNESPLVSFLNHVVDELILGHDVILSTPQPTLGELA